MAKVKDLTAIREKYARVTPQRSEDYRLGVTTPREDWAGATLAAEKSYELGVAGAVARKAFGKGVTKAGTGKWQDKARTIGAERWGPGVSAGVAAYETGFAPYRAEIEKTTMPPRYPTGDPRNLERVKAIDIALRKRKEAGG